LRVSTVARNVISIKRRVDCDDITSHYSRAHTHTHTHTHMSTRYVTSEDNHDDDPDPRAAPGQKTLSGLVL